MAAIRCPVCRADNATGPACRRCKADLSLLLALEEERAAALASARRALVRGEVAEAVRQAERADGLRNGDDASRLLATACLLARDYRRAFEVYRQARRRHRRPE
jgi:hypothetical protein